MYMHAPTTHTNPTEPTTRIGDGYFIVIFVENFMVKLWVKISRNFQTISGNFCRNFFSYSIKTFVYFIFDIFLYCF